MAANTTTKVLIAAGGTGGHIYPALAIADAFRAVRPDIVVEFVGTAHGLENKIVPPKGYKVHHLPIGRLNSNVALSERIRTVLSLPWAFFKSARLLRQERPAFVLGVGGHASGPLLLMASLFRYPTAIWEPNAMPGLANRILSRFVQDCWMVFDEARGHLHGRSLHQAGMPVRREIEEMAERLLAPSKDAPKSERPFRVLVFGGSLGARGLNDVIVEMVKNSMAENIDSPLIHIVHQTGASDFNRVREMYGPAESRAISVDLREYLHDMADQYANADLVICRSGTGTLSELAACGKPAILIPFPFAADDHQKKNAEGLVKRSAAILIEQKNLSAQGLRKTIDELRMDPERLRQMSRHIRKFHHPHAADDLVGEFLRRIS